RTISMIKPFLTELYNQTGGNMEQQVSMYDIGRAIGLDKAEAGATAEEIMIQGLAELKTLSGGIAITRQGLEELGITEKTTNPEKTGLVLGDGPTVEESEKKGIADLLNEIRLATAQGNMEYELLEEIIFDIKTLEIQLLSPRPKTAVIREILLALKELMKKSGKTELSEILKTTVK
ncbi:hypothetical protein, partial [Desulfomarina sp.]